MSEHMIPSVIRHLLHPFATRKPRKFAAILFALGILGGSAAGQAQIVVYDDALENGFQNFSYGVPGWDFASTAQVHSGTKAISFVGNSFNAVAMSRTAQPVNTSTYPTIHFWVHGGTVGGQHIRVDLYSGGNVVANGVLDSYIAGGSIAANAWREVTVAIGQPPLSYSGPYDRVDLQSDTAGAQPVLYVDDVSLVPPSAPPASTMQIEHDVMVGPPGASMVSDRFTWQDSGGHPRVASLAHNDTAPVMGSQGGALREYKFQLSNGQTRTATVTTYGNAGYGGFGYVTDHSSRYVGCAGDDSPLGLAFAGHWSRVFEGRHHAIFRFTQLYPRNCPRSGPVITRYLPVTIDWMFTTGHDNPVWAITYDVDQISDGVNPPVGADMYYDDSRAPYGELNIDGEGFYDLNGTSWGDRYKFIPTNAPGTSMTLNSTWTWNTSNTVPFVKEWIDAALGAAPPYNGDATMGIVQTQTMTQQDAGGARDPGVGSDITPYWTKTDADNIHSAGAFRVPNGDNWPYQANGDNLTGAAGSNNARLTWKTQYGFIGQTTYNLNDGVGATAPGYPKKSYSTYIVLGQHSTVPEPVDAQVTQVEAVQTLTLTASTGSVVTSGPAGNVRADNVTYAPPGYNHVYAALAFNASGNQLDANIAVGSGTLKKPMLIVGNFTGGYPPIQLGGVLLTADADYYASLRPAANELWITLNRDLSGATNHMQILSNGAPAAPTGVTATAFSGTRVDVSWNAVAGADSYQIDRRAPGGGFAQIGTPAGNSYSDTTASANTAYLYRARAVNGSGTSANSAPDLATTVIFTDAPLTAGTTIKAVHLSQLRTAVDAVRLLAALGAGGYSDAAVPGTRIRAVHVTELRSALDPARAALSLSALGYTDPMLAGIVVKAVHFQQLRDGVR
jgi:hypothetical protein